MTPILPIAFLAGLLLFSCTDDPGPEKPGSRVIKMEQVDLVAPPEPADSAINPYVPTIHRNTASANCALDSFLNRHDVADIAKRLYKGQIIKLNEEDPSVLFPKFLEAKGAAKIFYFRAITNSERSADGYYSEGLGLFGKEYIENNTREFLSFFGDSLCFSESDLATWARIANSEFEIISEGEERASVNEYNKKLRSNCKNCFATEKKILAKFCELLKARASG